jgi:hypothetical protein
MQKKTLTIKLTPEQKKKVTRFVDKYVPYNFDTTFMLVDLGNYYGSDSDAHTITVGLIRTENQDETDIWRKTIKPLQSLIKKAKEIK